MKNNSSKKVKLKIFRTLKHTITEWYRDFNNYSKLVLAVAIPVAILTIIQADGNLGDFGCQWKRAFPAVSRHLFRNNIFQRAGGR